jgi:polar amino acid transport system ATP-binding protein
MTVLQNVTLAPRKVSRTDRAQAEATARELLKRIGLLEKADEYPDRLSGGQQQRVAIVRALAMQPELMLFDEVTSALDPELVAEVLEVIRELAAGGMTMIIATHEMSFARDMADRVCFLDAGRILEEGPPEEIFTAPREERTQQFLQRIIEAKRL